MPPYTRLTSSEQKFTAAGVDVTVYVDGVQVALMEDTPEETVMITHSHWEMLGDIRVTNNRSLPPGKVLPGRLLPCSPVLA